MSELNEALTNFHLLRPLWLLAIPATLLLLWWNRSKSPLGSWTKVIDPRWLPFMLEGKTDRQRRQWPWAVAAVVAALAMSGPTWQQLPQPLHKAQSALVILLDLSPSMLAQDLKPDRLTRARHKLLDILKLRKEGQTALIVYSNTAHVVTPLTDDTSTIASHVPILHPDLIGDAGSNVEEAAELATQLLSNSGHNHGDLLLITDGITEDARENLWQLLRNKSLRLSILGVGTANGAPIPMPGGGFAKDSDGNIVVPKLERAPLFQLTRRKDGQYTDLTPNDHDLDVLQSVFNSSADNPLDPRSKQLDRTFDSWHDQGYWLALVLLPFVALAFRRGLLACLLLAPVLMSETVQAAEENAAKPNALQNALNSAFQTKNQRGQQAFRKQQFQQAQETFEDSRWKGSAAYRNGDYQTALQEFSKDNSATGLYNQGNALTQLGKIDDALEAYEPALHKNPALDDAAANKKLLEELKKQKQQNPENQHQQDSQNGDQQQNQEREQHQGGDQNEGQQQDGGQDSQPSPSQDGQPQSGSEQQPESGEPQQDQQSGQQQSGEEQSQQQDAQQQAQQAEGEQGEESQQQQVQPSEQEPATDAEKQQAEQLLRKIPDNPGAFLRKKFRYQQLQRQRQNPFRPKDQPKRW